MADAEILDPLGTRDHISAIKRLRAAVLAGAKNEELVRLTDAALSSFVALNLCPTSDQPQAKFGCFLLSHGQGILRGEGTKRDEQGVLVMGDASMELGDLCYAHGEERLKEE